MLIKRKPRNVTDGDNDATVPFTEVHHTRCVGVQKNTYVHRLKHAQNLDMKDLTLLDSDSNVTIVCSKKHVSNTNVTADSMNIETNCGVTT